eukprot:scaffold717_cov158-Amphora_coffeaeformis.AAC.2
MINGHHQRERRTLQPIPFIMKYRNVPILSLSLLLGTNWCSGFPTTLSSSLSSSRRRFIITTFGGVRASSSSEESTTTPTSTTNGMKILSGIRDLVDDYDLFLLDMWGVMHDGSRPYDGVLDVVQRLRAAGKRLIILSNSSKRRDNSVKMLTKLGFDVVHDFEQIITSGEVAYQMLLDGTDSPFVPVVQRQNVPNNDDNKKAVVLGSGDQDEEYVQSAGWQVAPPSEASLVVARGTFTVHDGTGVMIHKRHDGTVAYEEALANTLNACAARRLPMWVTNPDKVRPDAERPPMPGAIGDAYVAALARHHGVGEEDNNDNAADDDDDDDNAITNNNSLVKRIGKPFSDVYDLCFVNGNVDKSRICMVGDALETDVTGGTLAGIATVWVLLDGIHAPDIMEQQQHTTTLEDGAAKVLAAFNDKSSDTYAQGRTLQPDFVLEHFRW